MCAQLWQNLFALLYNIKLTEFLDLALFVLEAEALFKEKVSSIRLFLLLFGLIFLLVALVKG